jgi:hypothetical protein
VSFCISTRQSWRASSGGSPHRLLVDEGRLDELLAWLDAAQPAGER